MSLIDREEALDLIFNWKAKEPWDEFNQQVAFEIIHAMPSALPRPEGFDPEHLTEQDKKDILEALDWVKGTITEEVPSAQPDLQPTCNQLATDLISRQDAIIAVRLHRIDINDPKKIVRKSYEDVIRELPSAQPDRARVKEDRNPMTEVHSPKMPTAKGGA